MAERTSAPTERAFDRLVDAAEHHAELPPSQCVPRGGAISSSPVQAGHGPSLLVP
jgi:hypothetical protein